MLPKVVHAQAASASLTKVNLRTKLDHSSAERDGSSLPQPNHYTMSSQETPSGGNWLSRFEYNAEFDRFSVISVGFLLIGIIGGITVGVFARDHIWQIGVIAGVTMFSLSMMLAVAPMKYIVRSTILAIAVDVLFMLMNL
jgi:hypothetical protein